MSDDAKTTHTPEPWVYHEAQNGSIVHFNGESDTYTTVASYVEPDDADRIIKCVQAMSGITDPSAVPELVAAAEFALLACQDNIAYWNFKDEPVLLQAIDKLRPVLAKIKGVKS